MGFSTTMNIEQSPLDVDDDDDDDVSSFDDTICNKKKNSSVPHHHVNIWLSADSK